MALSGMTGFARRDGALGGWTWAVEARSVNGRNLETRFRGAPGFEGLERLVREAAQARFQRGQVSVGLQAKRTEGEAAVRINRDQLDRYLALCRSLTDQGAGAPRSDGLLALRGVIEGADAEDDEETRSAVEAAMGKSLADALDALRSARGEEGAALSPVLSGLVDRIAGLVAEASSHAEAQGPALKARYARRIADLAGEAADGLAERVVVEAALLAAKADVQEELDRLRAHVDAARALLTGEGAAGRRLDFLTQEFMREANTLCSKSASQALTAVGLELKAVIEQFREQIQNVE